MKLKNNKTFIIAEIGINHNGSLPLAFKLINSAKRAGADAVKFQTYITEERAPKNSPIFNILKKCELSFEDFKKIKIYCDKKKIKFFSTPFDIKSFNFLRSIKTKKIKIASFDTVNIKFLKYMSNFEMDYILSVGMSNLSEIKKAFNILSNKGKNSVNILHCISAYPTKENEANLNCIDILKKKFDCLVGQSDHTNDIFVSQCAVAKGARIIEKHYKLHNKFKCVDEAVSIDENKFKDMVKNIRRIEKILGNSSFGIRKSEKNTSVYRRKSR